MQPSGEGPFGGTGSNRVCDRELLIRSLRRSPERLREFARVLGVAPTEAAVARYIRKLRPATLTRDTRVTNHTFDDGRAVSFQAILAAGTAVLVDGRGTPVVRCRCGNPLLKPLPTPARVRCVGCPPDYRTERVCLAGNRCWRRHPAPPPVRGAQGCVVRDPFTGRQLVVRFQSGDVSCTEAAAVFRRYLDPSTPRQGSGGAAQIGDWFCIGNSSTGGPTVTNDGTKCTRGSDVIVTVPSGAGATTAPATPGPTPDANVRDCPSPSGGAGTGITTLSARGLSCEEARQALDGLSFSNRQPTISGWDCTTLNPGALGEGATYRCTQGAKAIRFTTGD